MLFLLFLLFYPLQEFDLQRFILCEATRAISFFLRLKNCQRRPPPPPRTGVFFLFGVIRIITCAVRTDPPPVRAIFAF